MFGTGLNACLTLGSLKDMAALLIHAVGFNLYLWAVLYTDYNMVIIKGCLYLFLSVIILYIAFNERSQFNFINMLTLVINFALIFTVLIGLFNNGAWYMVLYNSTIIVVSTMILLSGLQHGYFKQQYENE